MNNKRREFSINNSLDKEITKYLISEKNAIKKKEKQNGIHVKHSNDIVV